VSLIPSLLLSSYILFFPLFDLEFSSHNIFALKYPEIILKSFDEQLASVLSTKTRHKRIFVIHAFSSVDAVNTWCTILLEVLLHTSSYSQAGSSFFPAYSEVRTKFVHHIIATII
jgi:hypothetical protein